MAQATQAAFDAQGDVGSAPREADRREDAARSGVAAGTDAIRVSVHDDLAAIASEWRAFEATADCTVFQTYGWLSTWQRQVGDRIGAVPLIAAGRDAGGRLEFLLPLMLDTKGIARRLTWLGSDLCDYNAPLLAPGFAGRGEADFRTAWRRVLASLRSNPLWHYDLIDLEKMPVTVGAQRNPILQLGVSLHPRRAYSTRLADDWDTYYAAKRSASTRRRDRTKRNRLADFGEVRFVSPEDAEDIARTLDTLMAQKSRSFAESGAFNIFTRPGYPEFYRAMATGSGTREMVHVSRLDVGATTGAANFGLLFRGCYYHILASHADGEIGRFGPGIAHLHELLRYAMGRNCRVFDFTIGDERYKRDWCDSELELYDHVTIASWRGAAAALPLLINRRGKAWIKRHPALLAWALKARAAATRLKSRAKG